MSYEKLGFVKGQKLKAEHLNHMEEGIANAGCVSEPKLLGEIVLTNENCTNTYSNSLYFNDDLCANVSELLDAVAKNPGVLFMEFIQVLEDETVQIRLPIMCATIINGCVDGLKVWRSLSTNENGCIDVFECGLYQDCFHCEESDDFLIADVMSGVPLTIKVYAA